MEKLVVTGPTSLKGEVSIGGAKNAAVAILPATLLIDGVCTIENLPNISDIKTKTEIELNGYNAQYAINKYLKPYLYFMDIQGKMIYLSRINSDSKWEDLVKEQNYSIENKKFFNSMVEYGNIDKNRIEFDPFRDSMNRNFIDNIMPKIKTENIGDIYGRKRIISDDEIVQKFELGKYNFSEIYLCYYVNNLSDSKYESKFKWNEG